MGIISKCLLIVTPLMSSSLYIAYRLGPELPKACRYTGNHLGMLYRYFKITLKAMRPDQNSGELVFLLNKGSVNFKTFTREASLRYMEVKTDIRRVLPEELTLDPFQKFRIPFEKPRERLEGDSGSEILMKILKEQERLKAKGLENLKDKKFKEEF